MNCVGNCTVTSVIADGSAVATGVVRTTSLSHAGSLAAELVQPSAEVRISSGFNTTLRVLYASPQSIPPPLPTYPPQHVNASASCLQQHQGPSIHLQWSPPANSSGAKDLWYSVSCVSYGDTVEGLFKPTITQAILHPVAQNMPYSCGVTTVSSQGSSTTVADPVVTLNATICLPAWCDADVKNRIPVLSFQYCLYALQTMCKHMYMIWSCKVGTYSNSIVYMYCTQSCASSLRFEIVLPSQDLQR